MNRRRHNRGGCFFAEMERLVVESMTRRAAASSAAGPTPVKLKHVLAHRITAFAMAERVSGSGSLDVPEEAPVVSAADTAELISFVQASPSVLVEWMVSAAKRGRWDFVETAVAGLSRCSSTQIDELLEEAGCLFEKGCEAYVYRLARVLASRWPSLLGESGFSLGMWDHAAETALVEDSAASLEAFWQLSAEFAQPDLDLLGLFARAPSVPLYEFLQAHRLLNVEKLLQEVEILDAFFKCPRLAAMVVRDYPDARPQLLENFRIDTRKPLSDADRRRMLLPDTVSIVSMESASILDVVAALEVPLEIVGLWLGSAVANGMVSSVVLQEMLSEHPGCVGRETLACGLKATVARGERASACMLLNCARVCAGIDAAPATIEAVVAGICADLHEPGSRDETVAKLLAAAPTPFELWEVVRVSEFHWLSRCLFAEFIRRNEVELVSRIADAFYDTNRSDEACAAILNTQYARAFRELAAAGAETVRAMLAGLASKRASPASHTRRILYAFWQAAVCAVFETGNMVAAEWWRAQYPQDVLGFGKPALVAALKHGGAAFVAILTAEEARRLFSEAAPHIDCFFAYATTEILEAVLKREEASNLCFLQAQCFDRYAACLLAHTNIMQAWRDRNKPQQRPWMLLRAALRRSGASAVLQMAAAGLLTQALAEMPSVVLDIYVLESAEAWAAVLAAAGPADAGSANAAAVRQTFGCLSHVFASVARRLGRLARLRNPEDRSTLAMLVAAGLLAAE